MEKEFIVIGAGCVGLGATYFLAKKLLAEGKNPSSILVIEREEAAGMATTSQGAGLCGQVRSSKERVLLAMESVKTFREMQEDEQHKPDWHEVGSLRIALSDVRVQEFQQLEKVAKDAGLDARIISNDEAKQKWPAMDFSQVKCVLWCPSDGYMTPPLVAKAYEHQCRKMGVEFWFDSLVESLVKNSDGSIAGVHVKVNGETKTVYSKYVVNAAGVHAFHIAKLAGLELPIIPVRHEYFVTPPLDVLSKDMPCFRVPELTLYGRATKEGALLLGGWENAALHFDPRSIDNHDKPPTVQPDWTVLNNFETLFSALFPTLNVAHPEKIRIGKGWPTFSPDGRFIIGKSSQVAGFVMAGACNAHGISGSAGIGHLLVKSLYDENPSDYVKSLSPDRFTGNNRWNFEEAIQQAKHVYETYYGV